MDKVINIPVQLQGPPTSGAFAYLSSEHKRRASTHTSNHESNTSQPSDLLKAIRAALRGSGTASTASASPSAPTIHSSVRPFVDETVGEEELSWDDSTVCLSIGGVLRRKWAFGEQGETVRWACMGWIEQKMVSSAHHTSAGYHTSQSATSSAPSNDTHGPARPTFGPFARTFNQRRRDSDRSLRIRAAFIFLRTAAKLYLMTGTTYTVALPFVVRKAWPAYPHGVIMQRCLDPREVEEAEATGDVLLPSIFSLTSPFAELATLGVTRGFAVPTPEHPHKLLEEDEPGKNAVPVPANEMVVWVTDLFGLDSPETLMVTVDPECCRLSIWRYTLKELPNHPAPLMRSKSTSKATQPQSSDEPRDLRVGDVQGSPSNNEPGSSPSPISPALVPPATANSAAAASFPGVVNPPPPIGIKGRRERSDSHIRNDLSMNMNRMAIDASLETTIPVVEPQHINPSFWMQRIYSEEITADCAKGWQDIEVAIFDPRWDGQSARWLLAVCVPTSNTLKIYSVKHEDDLSVIVTEVKRFSACSILAVHATRANCADLLVVKPDGALVILTYGSVKYS